VLDSIRASLFAANEEEEAEFCQAVAESVGLGFELGDGKTVETGDVAPIAPKTHLEIGRGYCHAGHG
jgi:hypothetical protein